MGDLQAAISDLDQAVQANPNYADAYYNRGKAKTALGDATGAISDFTRAIQLNPNLPDAYGNRGILYAEDGNQQAALQDLQTAARLFQQAGDQDSYNLTLGYIQQIQQPPNRSIYQQR